MRLRGRENSLASGPAPRRKGREGAGIRRGKEEGETEANLAQSGICIVSLAEVWSSNETSGKNNQQILGGHLSSKRKPNIPFW